MAVAIKAYPPKSNQDLRNLFATIVGASIQDPQKQALIYYILKDCKPIADRGDAFAREVRLPHRFELSIRGFHALDSDHPKDALEYLTDPSLPLFLGDEILSNLLRSEKLEKSLPLAYYVAASPPLASEKLLLAFFSYLCETDLLVAYNFARKRAGSQCRQLFEQLVRVSLSKNAGGGSMAEQLIGLPLTDEEVSWLESFLLDERGSSLRGAKDTVIMRRIAVGNDFDDVNDERSPRGSKKGGADWEEIRRSLGMLG